MSGVKGRSGRAPASRPGCRAGQQLVDWAKGQPVGVLEEIARELEVSMRTVSRWVQATAEPTVREAVAIERLTRGKVKVTAWAEPS